MNPIVKMMKRYIKMPLKYALPFLFIGALVLSATATTGCISNTASPTPAATPTKEPTVTPTAASPSLDQIIEQQKTQKTPTETPTAAPAPTETPTLSSFHGLLVEHPASAGGDDLSADINKEVATVEKVITPFHRATIDGRDVYIGTAEQDNGLVVKSYIFPLGSYDEDRAAQKAYVKQFQGIGFTIKSDDTTNSLEESFITLNGSSDSVSVQALGCNTALRCNDAMSIYIPIQGSRTS